MNAHYSDTLQYAFVAGDSELKKLVELLQDRIGKVKIRANCADGIDREFETVNNLIAYDNPKSKAIRRVYLTTTSDDYSTSAVISLHGSRERGVLIEISGSEEFVFLCRESIQDIIAGMRPWYDGVCRVNFAYLFLPIFAIIFFQLVIIGSKMELDSKKEKIFLGIVPILLNIVLLPLMFVGNKLRDYIFPRAVFTIGQGKSRFEDKERLRWGVVIGFGVSFAAGILIAIWQAIVG